MVGTIAPSYDLSITGPYDSIWYSLDGRLSNHTASGSTRTISQVAWSALADGIITINFYANNSAGMVGAAQVQVFKDSSEKPPPEIPEYSIYLIIGCIGVISAIFIKKKLKS